MKNSFRYLHIFLVGIICVGVVCYQFFKSDSSEMPKWAWIFAAIFAILLMRLGADNDDDSGNDMEESKE